MRIAAITVPIILSAFFTIYKDKNFCLRIIILNFAAMKEFEAEHPDVAAKYFDLRYATLGSRKEEWTERTFGNV